MEYKEYLNIIEQALILDQNGKYAESDKLMKTANLKVSQNFGDILGGLASGAAGSALGGGGRINAPGAIAGGIAQQAFGGNPLIGAGVGYLASKLFPRKKRKLEQDVEEPSKSTIPPPTTETSSINPADTSVTSTPQPNSIPVASVPIANPMAAPMAAPSTSDLPPNIINKLMTYAADPSFNVNKLWQKLSLDGTIPPDLKRKAFEEFFKIKQQYQTLTNNTEASNTTAPLATNQNQTTPLSTTTVNPEPSSTVTPALPSNTIPTSNPKIREDLVQQALIEMYRAPAGVKITALNNFANNKKLSYEEKKKAYDIFMKNYK